MNWTPPQVDNPYGSDLSASSPGGDKDEGDEDEDEEDDPELAQEFMLWNDDDQIDSDNHNYAGDSWKEPSSGHASRRPSLPCTTMPLTCTKPV